MSPAKGKLITSQGELEGGGWSCQVWLGMNYEKNGVMVGYSIDGPYRSDVSSLHNLRVTGLFSR